MKKILSLLFLSVLCLQPSACLFAQDENYDAVYLQLKKEYTLNPDGSMDYRYTKKQKLQTYRSFHNLYGETFIVYHPDFQSLKVNEAYMIMADGKRNPSPANAFNEVLPGFSANAPAYNKLREMVITHSGTERNAVLNLDYVLHTKTGYYPCLMGNELLSETEPVKELTLVIRVPSGSKLRYSILNSNASAVTSKEGGLDVYTWKFVDVPAISTEDLQAGGNDLYPRLLFSTADRSAVYNDFVKQNAFSYELNPEMKQMVAALSSQYKDAADLVLKLQDKIVNEFRLYPVPLKYAGYTCRTPQETWNSNGGTPVEKAVLLTALLREAGLTESVPGFVIHGRLFDEAIGSLLDVEDVFVKVNVPETGVIWLSVNSLNAQNFISPYPDRVLVELSRPAAGIRKESNRFGQVRFDGSFGFNEKKQLTGSIMCTDVGNANPYLLFLRDKDKAKSLFTGLLISADLKDPVSVNAGNNESSVSFSVLKDKPFRTDSDYFYLSLPATNTGIDGLGIHLLPALRTTPLEIACVTEENDDFSFVLPANLKPFIPKEKKELKNSAGEFVFEVKMDGQKMTVHKSLKLNKRLVEPADYPGFKALIDHWNADRYREVVLVK